MRVLILANGDPPSAELAHRLAEEHDLLLATDGAAHNAFALGLAPAIVCGDFDSVDREQIERESPQAFSTVEFISTPDQNFADLEKAIRLAQERGAHSITITGAAGGRIDHTLANFALLLRFGREIPMSIVEDGSQVWAVTGAHEEPGALEIVTCPDDTISLIALESGVQVSITGVQWETQELALLPGTQGVSNVALGERVRVTVRGGSALVCHLTAGRR